MSDNIETLHEIDIEYQELAHESGVPHWRRAAVVNADREFVSELADTVLDALALGEDGTLAAPIITVSDAIRHTSVGPPARLARETVMHDARTPADASAGASSSQSASSDELVASVRSVASAAVSQITAVEGNDIINGAAHVSVLSVAAAAFSYILEIKLEYMLTCVFGALLSVILS